MNNILELTETFTLTPGAFDRYSNITPYAIFDMFQEVAAKHAYQLNAHFNKTNSTSIWLLLRSKYEIVQEITKPIKVVVKTWPHEPKRIDYIRDYQVFDLDNNLLIKGTSKWCIFDMKTNQISRELYNFPGVYLDNKNFETSLKKIELLPLSKVDFIDNVRITPSYLDINDHVNNAKYSFLIIDALNLSKDEIIQSVEFNFNQELKLNDIVYIYKKQVGNYYYVYGFIQDNLHFASKITIKNK